MKKAFSLIAFVCLAVAIAAAEQPKLVHCSPVCNFKEKHAHVLSRLAQQSPASVAKCAAHSFRFVARHPVKALKDVF